MENIMVGTIGTTLTFRIAPVRLEYEVIDDEKVNTNMQ